MKHEAQFGNVSYYRGRKLFRCWNSLKVRFRRSQPFQQLSAGEAEELRLRVTSKASSLAHYAASSHLSQARRNEALAIGQFRVLSSKRAAVPRVFTALANTKLLPPGEAPNTRT